MADEDYYADDQEEVDDQAKLQKALTEQYKKIQIEQQKKEIMRSLLDDSAYERLMNIRASNQVLYSQIVNFIISLVQSGRLQSKLSEKQFLTILQKFVSRQEPTINYKHK
ncbi:MAG: DNA-binding protein [Candidatus Micrarchaeia archaeon]